MTEKLDRLADETTLTHAIAAGWEPPEKGGSETDEPEEGAPAEPQDAGEGAGRSPLLDLDLALDEPLCKARQGVTTLRTVVDGWERRHGLDRQFRDGDAEFLASLDFCADSIEAALARMSASIDTAVEGRPSD
jgi:hypothetical protein